jgi:hypothetical protein
MSCGQINSPEEELDWLELDEELLLEPEELLLEPEVLLLEPEVLLLEPEVLLELPPVQLGPNSRYIGDGQLRPILASFVLTNSSLLASFSISC